MYAAVGIERTEFSTGTEQLDAVWNGKEMVMVRSVTLALPSGGLLGTATLIRHRLVAGRGG